MKFDPFDNIISLQPHVWNLLTQDIKRVRAFGNRRPSGERVLLFNNDTAVQALRPEFGPPEVEDALILSLL